MKIDDKYEELKNTPSDVNHQFENIRKCVTPGDYVVEFGVRECVSTWALLKSRPAGLISVDIVRPPEKNLAEVEAAAKEAGVNFRFIEGDSVYFDADPYDVLFVDTLHLYSQVVKELWRNCEKVRKYIIFHDSNIPEVRACIQDFLFNLNWSFVVENHEGTGLSIVKRIKSGV